MKTAITILTMLILLSCDSKPKRDSFKSVPGEVDKKTEPDNLIGEWGIYVSGVAYCNACPRVMFNVDGTGIIAFPNGEKEQIQWKREKDKLNIKNISTTSEEGRFSDGEYSMLFKKDGDVSRLTLTEIGTSYSHQLRR